MLLALLLALPLIQTPRDALVVVLDDVGVMDTPGMPNIESLTSSGLLFTRAYAFPICSPSRLAAMCATLPRRHGMGDIVNTYATGGTPSPYPPCTLLSLAEAVKGNGYATAFVGKYHLGRCGNLLQALFDVESSAFVQGWDSVLSMNPDSITFGPGTNYYSWDRVNQGARAVSMVYATDSQADAFIAWWSSTPSPKLGWLAFSAAHQPYDAPPGYQTQPGERENFLQVLEYADIRLGDVLAVVDPATTFTVLVGDNGTPDEARPTMSPPGIWKGTTREGGVRVPFVVQGPGISPGETDRLVSLLDVTPTLCDLLDISWKGSSDGFSVFDPIERTWVFTERYRAGGAELDDQAVIESDWKLRVFDPDGSAGPTPAAQEWYFVGCPEIEVPLVPGPQIRNRLLAELASVPPRL